MSNSKNAIKILFLTLRSDWGGAPKHIDILYKNLGPEFLTYFAAPISEPYGISWYKSAGSDRFFELEHRKFSISKLFALKNFIVKNDIKLIHVHGKGAGLYGRLLKVFLSDRIKVIFTFHGLHTDQYSFLKKKLYLFYERIFTAYTDLFINVSFGEKKKGISNGIIKENDSEVIYNAIPAFHDTNDKLAIRNELQLPNEKFIVLSIVRFSYAKNIEATLKIAEELISDNNIIFVIVGDGETRDQIEKQIKVHNLLNIILTGFKDNTDKYIAASDIYLSTSRWEGLPYALIECTMLGLPILASDVVGNNEVVKDNFNGRLFDLNQLSLGAEYIKQLKSDNDLRIKFSKNSKDHFAQNFSIDKMIFEIQNIYKTVSNPEYAKK
jgi:glycosyltransferase involved in cell wall biosynthesis